MSFKVRYDRWQQAKTDVYDLALIDRFSGSEQDRFTEALVDLLDERARSASSCPAENSDDLSQKLEMLNFYIQDNLDNSEMEMIIKNLFASFRTDFERVVLAPPSAPAQEASTGPNDAAPDRTH